MGIEPRLSSFLPIKVLEGAGLSTGSRALVAPKGSCGVGSDAAPHLDPLCREELPQEFSRAFLTLTPSCALLLTLCVCVWAEELHQNVMPPCSLSASSVLDPRQHKGDPNLFAYCLRSVVSKSIILKAKQSFLNMFCVLLKEADPKLKARGARDSSSAEEMWICLVPSDIESQRGWRSRVFLSRSDHHECFLSQKQLTSFYI